MSDDSYSDERERRLNQMAPFFEASTVLSCVKAYLDYYGKYGKKRIKGVPIDYLVEELGGLARVIEPPAKAGKRIRIVVC